jgi:hemoglobin
LVSCLHTLKETKMKTLIKATVAIALMVGAFAPVAFAEQSASTAPLYERLGGLRGITLVVDDFINRLVVNKTLNANPAINAGRKSSPAPYLKFQVSQMVCVATGGPCKYTGKGMKDSHTHLNITEKEWGVMASEFQKSLDKFKVPAVEQKELFEIVGTTKPDIVTRK